jgi:hypothetical protein
MEPETKAEIDKLSQYDMAYLWRFARPGHPWLSGEAGDYFAQRFADLGGMSPEISKRLGW